MKEMNKTMGLQNSFFPFKINTNLISFKNNKNKSFSNDKYKNLSYFKEKIFKNKKISRNQNNIKKTQTLLKSKFHSENHSKFFSMPPSQISKNNNNYNIKNKTTINSYFFKKKDETQLRRNYSAYYIKENSNLRKLYISDLYMNGNNIKNNRLKISDMDKRLSLLEKDLNLSSIGPKNKIKNKNLFIRFPPKKISRIKKIKEKEEQKNIIPDYLKEEVKIKGTNIMSPFCKKYRDKYLIKKLNKFFNQNENTLQEKKLIFDNKLNIIYSENKKIYQMKLELINKRLKERGQNERYKCFHSPSELQLKDMSKKVFFMKNVFDFAFPSNNMIRLQSQNKYKNKNNNKTMDYEKNRRKANNKINNIKEHMNKTCFEFKKNKNKVSEIQL